MDTTTIRCYICRCREQYDDDRDIRRTWTDVEADYANTGCFLGVCPDCQKKMKQSAIEATIQVTTTEIGAD